MFKNNLGYIPKAVESLLITNSDIHKYNTRNKDKMRSAYGKHEFMYSNFRFVGIHIWNYILDHSDVNVTLPKVKKNFKTHILADNLTLYCLVLSIHKALICQSNLLTMFKYLLQFNLT